MRSIYEVGTFWITAAGALVSLAVGLLTAWIALKSAPKRRLFYGMSDPVSLLAPQGAEHGLEVRRGNQPINDPRLIDVTLHSSGRQSIDSTLFDQERPLRLNVHVPIIDVLKAVGRPPEQAIPDYKKSGSTLEVGPGVLAAHQKITFTALVDGRPSLDLVSHLSGVQIRRQQASTDQTVRRISFAMTGAAAIAFAIFFAYTQFATQQVINNSPSNSNVQNVLLKLPSFGKPERIAYGLLHSYGLNQVIQYKCLAHIWENESGWNPRLATTSGAYGIPQALPGSKMASAGNDWKTDATTQIKWGIGFIKNRYETPCNAWTFYQSRGYY